MKKLLVSTDLDATLLDHQTYDYTAARPAIEQLKAHGCPIIFNSSKTQTEQTQLRVALKIQDPFIIENGAAVVIPPGQLHQPATPPTAAIKVFGPPYRELVACLEQLRQQQGYRFRGFSDLHAEDIAAITGLPLAGAIAAKQRLGSEPLCWEDSESAYNAFVAALAKLGLQTTQGGRFCHVMARTDKGVALQWLVEQYQTAFPEIDWLVVALGDSPNDVPMLRVADISVLIPNPHRRPFDVTAVSTLVTSSQPGPVGWADAITQLCRQYLNS
jgi:mannosyl-3-phosphoglycerate phosphatase